MRVIAGTLKSRTIQTLKGETTRPSSDRLKEAMFNQIGPYFSGGQILDVFSGSGAVAIEAISRGMTKATLIEKDRKAQAIIETNISNFKLKESTKLLKGDVQSVLKTINDKFDIIFLDPPYDYKEMEIVIELCEPLLKEDGILIMETDKFTDLPDSIKRLIKIKEKKYGFAKLHTYEMSQ